MSAPTTKTTHPSFRRLRTGLALGMLFVAAAISPAAASADRGASNPATPPTAHQGSKDDQPTPPGREPRGQEKKQLQDDDEDGASTGALTTYLTYHGGWTQTSPRIYLILWGADWKTSAGDPYNEQNYLYRFYAGVGGSAWNALNTQYGYNCGSGAIGCNNGVRIQNPANQLKGWMYDTSTSVAAQPTVTDLESAVRRAVKYFGDTSVNAQYVIATAHGHRDQKSIASRYCAWHNFAYTGNSYVSYTSMPYLADMGTTCGMNKVNAGSAGILDGVSILAGHEYSESVTDPFLDAWTDAERSENADKCLQWSLGGYFRNTSLSTGTFAVEPQWSNYHLQQFGNGCYFN